MAKTPKATSQALRRRRRLGRLLRYVWGLGGLSARLRPLPEEGSEPQEEFERWNPLKGVGSTSNFRVTAARRVLDGVGEDRCRPIMR